MRKAEIYTASMLCLLVAACGGDDDSAGDDGDGGDGDGDVMAFISEVQLVDGAAVASRTGERPARETARRQRHQLRHRHQRRQRHGPDRRGRRIHDAWSSPIDGAGGYFEATARRGRGRRHAHHAVAGDRRRRVRLSLRGRPAPTTSARTRRSRPRSSRSAPAKCKSVCRGMLLATSICTSSIRTATRSSTAPRGGQRRRADLAPTPPVHRQRQNENITWATARTAPTRSAWTTSPTAKSPKATTRSPSSASARPGDVHGVSPARATAAESAPESRSRPHHAVAAKRVHGGV